MGQGLLVVSAFLAAGEFEVAAQHLRVVVCGGEERGEPERVLAMWTRTVQLWISKGGGGQIEAR